MASIIDNLKSFVMGKNRETESTKSEDRMEVKNSFEYLIGTPIILNGDIGYLKFIQNTFKIVFDDLTKEITEEEAINAGVLNLFTASLESDENERVCKGKVVGRLGHNVQIKWSGIDKIETKSWNEAYQLVKDPFLMYPITKKYGDTVYKGYVDDVKIVKGEKCYTIQFDDGDEDTIPFVELLRDLGDKAQDITPVEYEKLSDSNAIPDFQKNAMSKRKTPTSTVSSEKVGSPKRKRGRPRKRDYNETGNTKPTEIAPMLSNVIPNPNQMIIPKPPGSITAAKFWGTSLKMALQQVDDRVVVGGFTKMDNGEMGEAEASRLVAIGDTIHAINNKTVCDMSFENVVEELITCPRPVTVSFRAAFPHEVNELKDMWLSTNGDKASPKRAAPKSKKASKKSIEVPQQQFLNPLLDTRSFPSVKQIVRVTKPGLNIQLKFINGYVLVDAFTRGTDNFPGEVEASGRVQPGDTIVEINGTSLCNLKDIDTAVNLIKSSPRPVYVVFDRLPFAAIVAQNSANYYTSFPSAKDFSSGRQQIRKTIPIQKKAG